MLYNSTDQSIQSGTCNLHVPLFLLSDPEFYPVKKGGRQNILFTFWLNINYKTLIINTMKNYIKASFLAVAVCFSLAACKGNSSSSSSDSAKVDSSSTTKVDSTVKSDTTKKDTGMKMGADTSKKVDTVKKVTTKTTEKKKTTKKTE